MPHPLLDDAKKEMPVMGFLTQYLAWMRSENPKGADDLEADMIELFSSEMGLRVLKLFEKSTINVASPLNSPSRALREINAVRNFNLEIRRIVSHGR